MAFRLTAIILAWLCAACSSPPQDIHETRFMMGTLVKFTISGAQKNKALEAIKAASSAMQQVEDEFTIYGSVKNSVKAFNTSPPGTPVILPPDVDTVLRESLAISKQSDGAFNPLLGSLDLLWGFSLPHPPDTPPAAAAIRKALIGTSDSDIRHTLKGWVRLNPATKLDFGGIAKGYAIDRGIEALKQHGIANAILDAGGDLRVIGNHHGKPWRIGIRHPRGPGKVLGWFDLEGDKSIVTSGDYERFFFYKGKRYHHILNPQTGMPARTAISTTILASNATLADAWSTALFVMGIKGLPIVAQHGMEAVLMDEKEKLYAELPADAHFHPAIPKADIVAPPVQKQGAL